MSLLLELKSIRKQKHLSQAQVSDLIRMPQGHLSNIENGKADPKLSSVVEIARVLDHEVILVPRSSLSLVHSVLKGNKDDATTPAWLPDDEDIS